MFSYFENNHNSEMVFDHSVPDIDRNDFQKQDWSNTVYASEKGELTIGWFWSCSSLYTYTSHMEYNSYKELSPNPLLLLFYGSLNLIQFYSTIETYYHF